MSKQLHRAPLALSSDGAILLNVAMFDAPKTPERLFQLAISERGPIFIGIVVGTDELAQLRDDIDDAALQAAFRIVGSKQARARRKLMKSPLPSR